MLFARDSSRSVGEGLELIKLFLQIKSKEDKEALLAHAKKIVDQQVT